ncbi:Rv3654c family TadE-like protein [Mycobacterium sp. 1164985.4]|uniref:Rv3654c family TadE-like protein n=1 Tax=Mycobacterium sp. 1164985.4 TaxID=1834069 RepID=UPI0025707912|nr:Rv3654c family TadE-like protein [Mycobacterium sp. 1164985.4]
MWNRVRADRGSTSLIGAVMIAAVVTTAVGAGYLGVAVTARHRAQATADLAALAAAHRFASGIEEACTWAAAVADAMRTEMVQCEADDLDIVVAVQVPVVLGRFGVGTARALARAGPAGT